MRKLFECINVCLQNNIPFAAYRLPNKEKISLVISLKNDLNTEITDYRKGFILHPFHNKDKVYFLPADIYVKEKDIDHDLIVRLKDCLIRSDKKFKFVEKSTTKEEYMSSFQNFREALLNKIIEKAVLSKCKIIDFKQEKSLDLFENLCKKYKQAFVSFFFHPETGIWLGATPELLLEKKGDYYKTVSLAGTKQIKGQWTAKEKHEQQIVTDYISGIIKQIELQDYEVDGPIEIDAGHLKHLRTSFRFSLSYPDKDFKKLLKDLHPTPAVCGIPKTQALELILKTESHDRKYYTGFLGPVQIKNSSILFVNLRCMNIVGDKAVLYSGGGITVGSDAEKEWQECLSKEQILLVLIKNLK